MVLFKSSTRKGPPERPLLPPATSDSLQSSGESFSPSPIVPDLSLIPRFASHFLLRSSSAARRGVVFANCALPMRCSRPVLSSVDKPRPAGHSSSSTRLSAAVADSLPCLAALRRTGDHP
nr:unnamed protein product [Digitaria exilis]